MRLGFFSNWALLGILVIVSLVDFIVFVLFLEAVGVRENFRMAIENRLEALCFVRSPQATRAPRATSPPPSGLVALQSAESRGCYSQHSCCCEKVVDTARCCHLPSCDPRCLRDLRRKAAVIAAMLASALLYDTAVWSLVWVCGRARVFVAMGSQMVSMEQFD